MKWIARLGLLLLLLAAAAGLLYLAADAWLESAGGQRALERELAQRAGMPVELRGDFEIRLLPTLGVEGTELVIGGPGIDEAFLYSREYSVTLAIRPLLEGEVRVESIRLAHAVLRPDRMPPPAPGAPDQPAAAPRLPAVGTLRISDLALVFPGEQEYRLDIGELAVEGFEERRDTPIRIEAAGFGQVDGRFRWDSADSRLSLAGTWAGVLSGGMQFSGEVFLDAAKGNASARWPARPAAGAEALALSTDFVLGAEALTLDEIVLSSGAQTVSGKGCLLFGGTPSLQLDLVSDALDLDRLPAFPSPTAETGADDAPAAGLEIAVRVRVGELRKAGVLARNAVINVGKDPDCHRPG